VSEPVEYLLVLDIGNTAISVGVFLGDRLHGPWRLSSRRERSADEYGILLRGLLQAAEIDPGAVSRIAVSCVVPPVVAAISEMAGRYFGAEPLFVGPGVRTGMPILTDNPHELGADRIVNAVAAFARHGGPTVVVDFGTATTFDAISARGEYVGGVIAPGVSVAAEALFQRAAKLPRVELRKPRQVIGRNTVASIQSGLVHGYAALVDGIVSRMAQELAPPEGKEVTVIATGGHAATMAAECRSFEKVEPDLTLDGLKRIWARNQPGRPRC
jgi:type III pantothenate kinase